MFMKYKNTTMDLRQQRQSTLSESQKWTVDVCERSDQLLLTFWVENAADKTNWSSRFSSMLYQISNIDFYLNFNLGRNKKMVRPFLWLVFMGGGIVSMYRWKSPLSGFSITMWSRRGFCAKSRYTQADTKPVFSKAKSLDERTACNIAFYGCVSIIAGTRKDKIPRSYNVILVLILLPVVETLLIRRNTPVCQSSFRGLIGNEISW